MESNPYLRGLLHFLVALWLASGATGCQVFPKAKNSLRDALSEGIQQARIDSLLRASADSVLNEVLKSERFETVRREYGLLLRQTSDTLYHVADTMLNTMLRQYTQQWLDQVNAGVQKTLSDAKNNLTDQQLKNYLTGLVERDLPRSINSLIDQLSAKLRSPGFRNDIIELRAFLDLQADTLSRSATRGAVAVLNDSLLPRIDSLLLRIVEERDRTQRGVTSTVWIILGGIVAILLLGFLVRTLYLKYQYRRMLKLITQEVDKIDSQAVYDRLVGKVSEQMKAQGLEKILRKDILEEEGLINQPEWKDKNEQLLRTLVEEINKLQIPEAEVREKLKQAGLEEHFESVKRSVAPPPDHFSRKDAKNREGRQE